jgi:acyl-CoA dehydrogenase
VRGEKTGWFALTEPNAGSDAAAIETSAVRDGENWLLNGTKIFISEADVVDFLLIPAVTDKKKGARGGITTFVVDREIPNTPGYKVVRLIETMGDFVLCEVLLDNCIVPASNVVGEVGQGWIMAQRFLGRLRLHHGAWALGMAERCLEMAKDYAKQRVTFGKPLAERQAIQWMLADSAIEIYATGCMVYHCAWKADQAMDIRQEAAIVKVYGDEMAQRVVSRTLQIYGGLGYTKDLPIERFYRTARMLTIGGGTAEMMRLIVARNVLGR